MQVRTPRGGRGAPDPLADLHGRIDLVVIDAPCTGTGTWRRNPDAKWRVRPGALTQRVAEQVEVLDRAAALVKPGGRIGYITCSVLAEEGPDQVAAFLGRHSGFRPEPAPIEQAFGSCRRGFPDCSPLPRPRSPHDAAPDRHRRIFCEHPAPRGVNAAPSDPFDSLSIVIAGLVPAIPIRDAGPCPPKRDGRDKAGHDELRGFG